MGESLTLQCDVTTPLRGITSTLSIVWISNSEELRRVDNVMPIARNDIQVYTDSYTISPLSTADEGRTYWCIAVLNSSPPITRNTSTTLDVTGKEEIIQLTMCIW